MDSLREQADRHRAARGLTPDQRHYVAVTLYQWWTVGGPHRQTVVSARGSQLRELGDRIDEGVAKYPEIVRAAVQSVRERIERFRVKRATPRLVLTSYGPQFVVREYDHWGQYQRTKTTHGSEDVRPRSYSGDVDWVAYLERRPFWDTHNARIASEVVSGKIVIKRPVPQWLRDGVREWRRIDKRSTLIPTPAERQRYRKACGLIKSRKVKATV